MELAGLKVVMDADFSAVYSSFAQANSMLQTFAENVKAAFNGIPNFKSKFNFTSNGASQAAQDAREYGRAQREAAEAEKIRIQAQILQQKEQDRQNAKSKQAKDLYGQMVAESNALVRAYYNEAAAQIKAGNATDEARIKLEKMREAAFESQQQLSKIEQGAGRFTRQVGNYAIGTAALSQQVKQLTSEIPNFFINARIGFQSLSNNLPGIFNELTRIREANDVLKASGEKTVPVFQQLLKTFNPLNIAFGFGIGLLTAYGPKLVELVKGLFDGSEASKRAAQSQKEFQEVTKKATDTASESARQEQVNANMLYSATQNVTLSMLERKRAAQALIDIAPQIFSGLNQEAIVAGKAANAYKLLTQAIKNKIAVEVGEEQAKELLKQLQAAEKVVNTNSELLGIQEKLKSIGDQRLELSKKGFGADSKQIDDLNKEYNKLFETAKSLSGANDFTKKIFPDKKDVLSGIDAMVAAQAQYEKTVTNISSQRAKIDSLFDKSKPGTDASVNTGISDRTSEDLDDQRLRISEIYNGFIKDQTEFGEKKLSLEEEIALNSKIAGGAYEQELDRQKEAEARALNAKLEIYRDVAEKKKQIQQQENETASQYAKRAKAILEDSINQSAVMLGQGIGQLILGTTDIPNIFKGIGIMLADQVSAFGKTLIEYATAILLAKKSLAFLFSNPALGIIAGVGLVTFAEVAKSVLLKQGDQIGQTKFADGGVVYGPTNALIGEYSSARSNPEIVAPLDKLKTILKSENLGNNRAQVFIPEVTVKGQDLLIVFNRAQTYFKR